MSDFERNFKVRLTLSIALAAASLVITVILWSAGAVGPRGFMPTLVTTGVVLGIVFAAVFSVWWLAKYGMRTTIAVLQSQFSADAAAKANASRGNASKVERIGAFVASLWIAFAVGNWSHQHYWTRQQSYSLYQFSAQAKAPLVPIACKGKRGVAGIDFIVASVRTYRQTVSQLEVEACWYPIDRFKALFPHERPRSDADVIRDHYDRMYLHPRAFSSKPPSRWILLGIPLGIMIALFGFLIMVLGPIKRVEHEPDIEEKPAVDPTALAADLVRLRKNLAP